MGPADLVIIRCIDMSCRILIGVSGKILDRYGGSNSWAVRYLFIDCFIFPVVPYLTGGFDSRYAIVYGFTSCKAGIWPFTGDLPCSADLIRDCFRFRFGKCHLLLTAVDFHFRIQACLDSARALDIHIAAYIGNTVIDRIIDPYFFKACLIVLLLDGEGDKAAGDLAAGAVRTGIILDPEVLIGWFCSVYGKMCRIRMVSVFSSLQEPVIVFRHHIDLCVVGLPAFKGPRKGSGFLMVNAPGRHPVKPLSACNSAVGIRRKGCTGGRTYIRSLLPFQGRRKVHSDLLYILPCPALLCLNGKPHDQGLFTALMSDCTPQLCFLSRQTAGPVKIVAIVDPVVERSCFEGIAVLGFYGDMN